MDRDYLQSIDRRLQRIENELLDIKEKLGILQAKAAIGAAIVATLISIGVRLWL